MSIKDVKPVEPARRIMGVDCSTQSFAYSIFEDKKLVQWGEIEFKGSNVFERLADGQRKVRAFRDNLKTDKVVFESAVYVQNKKTVILLAYAFGAIISALIDAGAEIDEANPLLWQRAIGNPPLTPKEKQSIMKGNPDRSKTWYQAAYRNYRKDRTRQWVKKNFGLEIESDNICDAIGLGWFGANI